ncbi:MAG TPA: glutamate-1-semialdehyde 2,1-aminomutase [Methylomirabilota bacterium]|nr:glutamate-1-semialdehyde 2,1-aminomutase [Methylomirabilota bacterium]
MTGSDDLFERAQRLMPGGVNSPVRAFRGVGGAPFFVARGDGARVFDVDGRSYVDFLGSWGPLILGHAAPAVVEALTEAVRRGTSYGAPTPGEVEMADLIGRAVPSMEMVRLVSSGTEAGMSAIRLARGATGRDFIIKFDGCYHGHADSLLVKAGSGGATFGVPDSLGVPPALAALTLTVPFNDLDAVRRQLEAHPEQVAAVIVEPVAGNMGVVPPAPGFLAGLRDLTARHGSLLIFDEVITGFRVAWGGAQARYGVRPDLTCLGKIIGGGLPVGAYGGSRRIMERVSPLGGVYQAGTLSGNPLAVAAGLATLRALQTPGTYERLEALGARVERDVVEAARAAGVPVTVNRVGSMLTVFFTDGPVTDYSSAKRADTTRYARYFHAMREGGVFLAPSQFEAAFVSLAHRDEDLAEAARAGREALQKVR